MKYRFTVAAVVLLLGIGSCYGQKLGTKTGTIQFAASVPSFEPVAAEHNNVSAILNTDTGEIAVLILVTGFRFEIALMEEHFNENYMESEIYPKAVLRGKLIDFDLARADTAEYILDGSVTIHGVSKQMLIPVVLKHEGGSYLLTSNFKLRPQEFNIEIPKVVANKIAEEVIVSASIPLNKI